jgi:ABC-type antimicrobial peptide transport system permease subunit
MFKNYFKTAIRSLRKNKVHSFINIAGLSVGMAASMLIGLWIWDEVSFDKNFPNYNRIARVMQHPVFNDEVQTWDGIPMPLGPVLQKSYGSDFKYVVRAGYTGKRTLADGERKFKKSGNYMEPAIAEMLSLNMLQGTRSSLNDMHSVLLSASTAKSIFGNDNPMGKVLKLDNNDKAMVKVTGVYEDIPNSSSFADLTFIAPWELMIQSQGLEKILQNPWGASWFQTFAQVADHADMAKVSLAIKDALAINAGEKRKVKTTVFLHPMSKWHLYGEFKNGVNTGGRILYVWLFGITGIFILILACINFMNLSTARSEKRAKEVGVRKTMGSARYQLIYQFFSESLVVTFFAFALSLLLVQLVLPFFNTLADKKIQVLWANPVFWLSGIGFAFITGLIAGSYPALYLSSFKPIKVLRGTLRAGRFASIPRKALVVTQFTVSVVLIIGTIVIFRQIRFAQNRPVGYNRNGLVTISSDGIWNHLPALRNELLGTGTVTELAATESKVTNVFITNSGFNWKGKDPAMQEEFVTLGVTTEFGKTVNWELISGRDFSNDMATDSNAIILNEAAVQYTGLKNPVGETIQWGKNEPVHVIGVVKNMVTQSPYEPIRQMFFYLRKGYLGNIDIRVNPKVPMQAALGAIEQVVKKYKPDDPFEYRFVDEEYAKKFDNEKRIGKLATSFAILAIFISCLGLFGMASFMAEQRTKEIGVRKVLGASVFNLWGLLSKEFVVLVSISLLIAIPLASYFMDKWLQNFTYRAGLSWWIFAAAGMGALVITLLTVSSQAIRAALTNPVKALRSE